MEVKMNKEIRDYQESMFFGLNFRQCAFSVLAILAAVAIYFGTKGRLPDGCACLGQPRLLPVDFSNITE